MGQDPSSSVIDDLRLSLGELYVQSTDALSAMLDKLISLGAPFLLSAETSAILARTHAQVHACARAVACTSTPASPCPQPGVFLAFMQSACFGRTCETAYAY